MRHQSNHWLIPVLLAIGVAGALWYYRIQSSEPEIVSDAPREATTEEPRSVPGPLHPVETAPVDTIDAGQLEPLPPLGESDAYFRLGIVDVLGTAAEDVLASADLIERLVATVDNLTRSQVAGRVRPLTPVAGLFFADGQDASGEFTASAANFERYDELVAMLDGADLNEAIVLYRRFYPMFQSAYQELGYPDAYFNDRLVAVVDHLLETPDVSGPIELVRPHVLYEYRDAELEALSSGQKMIIRLGEEHASTVKRRLRELRSLLVSM